MLTLGKYHLTLQFKYEYEYFTLSQDLQMIMLHLTTIYLYMLIGEEASILSSKRDVIVMCKFALFQGCFEHL